MTLKVDEIQNTSGGAVTLTDQEAAKAWVNFNGTGTVAIRDSLNNSSITDHGTGQYTANFTNALSSANYAITATGCRSSSSISHIVGPIAATAPATTSIRVRAVEYDASSADSLYTSIVCHI